MITFGCLSCHKKLSVREDVQGKKIKCPACGELMRVPTPAAVADNASAATNPDRTAGPRADAEASDAATSTPSAEPDATVGLPAHDSGHDASLTNFLAPAEAPDELGRLGKYRILKILGHGGMGVVYQAEDSKLKRLVAIKAMLPGLAGSASATKRFMREAEAMAAVEHDHIVRIYDTIEDRGVAFMAMEFLRGEPLDERLKREERLPVADVLRIGREVAEALAAAHATGLIHRDIKPGNIWLEDRSAGNTSSLSSVAGVLPAHTGPGRVKILDFGLARATSKESGLTQEGAILGTPAYMSPEQSRGGTVAVDARSDLFSLGVVLYRICTGELPFNGTDTVSTLMAVVMNEPAAPDHVNAKVPHELSELVMKLLQKDPAKRFGSAVEVVQAIQAIEKQRAPASRSSHAQARPAPVVPSWRPVLLVLAAFLGILCLAAIGGVYYYWQTNNGTVRLEINDAETQVTFDNQGPTFKGVLKQEIHLAPGEYSLHVQRGRLAFDTDKFILQRGETVALKIDWLKEGRVQVLEGSRVIGSKALSRWDVLAGPLTAAMVQRFQRHTGPVRSVALSGDGQLVATGSGDKMAILWEAATGKILQTFPEHTGGIEGIALRGDGKQVLTGSWDGTAILWDAVSGQKIQTFRGHTGPIHDVALSSDGKRVLTASSDKTAILWDAASGKVLQTLRGHTALVSSVALSNDGKLALTGSGDNSAILWEADSARKIRSFYGHAGWIRSVALSGDGQLVLTAADDKTAILWRAADGTKLQTFQGHTDLVWSAVLSGDGKRVLTGSGDKTAILWEVATGRKLQTCRGHLNAIQSVALSRDGQRILTGSSDSTAILWGVHTAPGNPGYALRFRPQASVQVPSLKIATKGPVTFEGYVTPTGNGGQLLVGGHSLWIPVSRSWQFLSTGGVVSGGLAESNQRVHVAAVRTDKDLRLYQNGQLIGTTNLVAIKGQTQHVAFLLGGTTFDGLIDAVRISRGARYLTNFTPAERLTPDKDTLALYHFEEGAGNVLKDSSGNNHHGTILGAAWVNTTPPQRPLLNLSNVYEVGKGGIEFGTQLTLADARDPLRAGFYTKVFQVKLFKGKAYDIHMESAWMDSFLRLEDSHGKPLAQDDDSGGGQNSRMYWEPAADGTHRIVATTFEAADPSRNVGPFTLRIRETPRLSERQSPPLYLLRFKSKWNHYFGANAWQTGFSSDGTLFLAAGDANSAGNIPIWEAATSKIVQELVPRNGVWFSNAHFVPGSKYVVAAYSQEKELYLWDAVPGKIVRKFVGHTAFNPSFAVSPTGKHLLSWADDRTVRLWDLETGKELAQLEGHTDKVKGASFSADGRSIVTWSPDLTVRLWEVATGKEPANQLKRLTHNAVNMGNTKPAGPMACFSPDSKQLLSYSPDSTLVQIWDIATKKEVWRSTAGSQVQFAEFLANGRFVVVRNAQSLRLLDGATGKLLRAIQRSQFGPQGHEDCIAASPDGRLALARHSDGSVRLLDLMNGNEMQRYVNCPSAQGFSFSPDGRMAVAGSFRKGVFAFRLPPPPEPRTD